ncbi:DUF4123 domain-containing protein [Lysobacter sp. F6437]|uniref:DUF4123 domain-containing protein n=1 Tax=Lysobacter sp. F6437 TaxID=3459296 RepID=UPI00403D9527
MGIDHRQLAAHAFAILNPLQVGRSEWADLPITALIPPALSAKAAAMPLLLDLAQLDEPQRIALLIRADAWDRHHDAPFFSLLLQTDASAERVAAHLTGKLLHTAPDGAKIVLRWHDPRVFRHFCWLLTDAQLRRLGGPVTAWTWRDISLEWHTHRVPSGVDIIARLQLSAEQWAVIGRIGVLNRTLAQLQRNAHHLVVDDEACRRIDGYLQHAYDVHEFIDEADARLFAEQGMRSPYAHAHPEIGKRVARARARTSTYVGACADLDLTALDDTAVLDHRPARTRTVTQGSLT